MSVPLHQAGSTLIFPLPAPLPLPAAEAARRHQLQYPEHGQVAVRQLAVPADVAANPAAAGNPAFFPAFDEDRIIDVLPNGAGLVHLQCEPTRGQKRGRDATPAAPAAAAAAAAAAPAGKKQQGQGQAASKKQQQAAAAPASQPVPATEERQKKRRRRNSGGLAACGLAVLY